MDLLDTQLTALHTNALFRRIASNQPVSLYEFDTVTNFLICLGIPYDISFVPGTRKEAAALQLTIHINPTRTEVIVVALEPGSTVFTPSP